MVAWCDKKFYFFFVSRQEFNAKGQMLNKPAKMYEKKLVGTDVMYTFVFIGNLEFISLSLHSCLFAFLLSPCRSLLYSWFSLAISWFLNLVLVTVKCRWRCHGVVPVRCTLVWDRLSIYVYRPLGHERLDLVSELPHLFPALPMQGAHQSIYLWTYMYPNLISSIIDNIFVFQNVFNVLIQI